MVIDTSAIIAIMNNEPERRRGRSRQAERLIEDGIVGGAAGVAEALAKQTVIRHYQPTGTIAEIVPCTPPSLTRRPS